MILRPGPDDHRMVVPLGAKGATRPGDGNRAVA